MNKPVQMAFASVHQTLHGIGGATRCSYQVDGGDEDADAIHSGTDEGWDSRGGAVAS
jgi:hypothetical protein